MIARILEKSLPQSSFFLFGPRGTGKSTLISRCFSQAILIDLLRGDSFLNLNSEPSKLEAYIPQEFKGWVVIDEVQKVPQLLDEVHRLIEKKKISFVLTGSSARKLKKEGVNLLAGRALTYFMTPLLPEEIGPSFDLDRALRFGLLPTLWDKEKTQINPNDYLTSYVQTYLKEEIQQEGITRNLGAFSRFLQTASFSQGEVLNISQIARESGNKRKQTERYFEILEDLLIAERIPVFSRRAKRKLVQHPKFYFFDVGVYRAIRPRGPLDSVEEIEGVSYESLVFQVLRSTILQRRLNLNLYYWRTSAGNEVDFILYGEDGFYAFEVKRKQKITKKDLSGLRSFQEDYPEAKCFLICGEHTQLEIDKIKILPFRDFFSAAFTQL